VKLEFEILFFVEGEKLENMEKTLRPRQESTTDPNIEPRYIGGRRDLSPLHHPGQSLYHSVIL